MQKLKNAALVVGLVTVALWASLSLTGCGAGALPAPRTGLDASADIRRFICGGWEALETQAREYLEAAEAKEEEARRAREENESSSEEAASAEDDSAVEPTPPTVPDPSDG